MLFSSFRTPLFIPEYFILSNVIASRLPLCTIDLVEEWTSMKFDQASYVVYIKHVLTLFSQIYSSAWKCFRIYILEALNKIGCKWMWTKRELFSSAKPPSNNTLFYANYDKCEKKHFLEIIHVRRVVKWWTQCNMCQFKFKSLWWSYELADAVVCNRTSAGNMKPKLKPPLSWVDNWVIS